jgi:hypothetical protein
MSSTWRKVLQQPVGVRGELPDVDHLGENLELGDRRSAGVPQVDPQPSSPASAWNTWGGER